MPRLARLGKFLLVLGFLGLLRLLPEIFGMGTGHGTVYAFLVTLDAVLALLTGASGEGLWKGKDWAPKLALQAGGTILPISIGWGIPLVRQVMLNPHPGYNVLLLPRVLFYAVSVGVWPYAIRSLIVNAPPERRRSLWLAWIAWLVVGVAITSMPYISFRYLPR